MVFKVIHSRKSLLICSLLIFQNHETAISSNTFTLHLPYVPVPPMIDRLAGHFSRPCGIHAQHLFTALILSHNLQMEHECLFVFSCLSFVYKNRIEFVLTHRCIQTFEHSAETILDKNFASHQLLANRQRCINIITEPLDIELRTLRF